MCVCVSVFRSGCYLAWIQQIKKPFYLSFFWGFFRNTLKYITVPNTLHIIGVITLPPLQDIKKYIFLCQCVLLSPDTCMDNLCSWQIMNKYKLNLTVQWLGNFMIVKWINLLIEYVVQLWSHFSIIANCINNIQNSALNAHLSLFVWNIILVTILNPGAVHFGTSGIIYFWTHILLYCLRLGCPSTSWILCCWCTGGKGWLMGRIHWWVWPLYL